MQLQQAELGFAPAAHSLLSADPADWPVAEGWRGVTDAFFASDAGRGLLRFLNERLHAGAVVYPPSPLRALAVTPPETVHAVVLGQDPYHGAGQAEGLAFSVAPGVKLPPSLRNIYKELGVARQSGSLLDWAQRGVLLLNATLTVEEGQAGSHAGKGWEVLTDRLVDHVAAIASPCVYFLWGAHAQQKAQRIRAAAEAAKCDILVLQANHPSPLSASRLPVPFIGCGHFAQARQWLSLRGVAAAF